MPVGTGEMLVPTPGQQWGLCGISPGTAAHTKHTSGSSTAGRKADLSRRDDDRLGMLLGLSSTLHSSVSAGARLPGDAGHRQRDVLMQGQVKGRHHGGQPQAARASRAAMQDCCCSGSEAALRHLPCV